MTEYEIGLDKNGDGFIAMDAQAGDPLNLVPTPVTYDGLAWFSLNCAPSLEWKETPYGVRQWSVIYTGGVVAAFQMGRDGGGSVAYIPVNGSTQYTAAVWVRADTTLTGANLDFFCHNQALSIISPVTTLTDIPTTWTRMETTFTTGPSDTHITLTLRKPAATGTITVLNAGYMLVEGDTLPDAFNSGDASDLTNRITDDVFMAEWRIGMDDSYQYVSAPTRGQITVRNDNEAYSPESASISLDPGTPVRIRAIEAGNTYTLFTGRIDHVEVQPGSLAGRFAKIVLSGLENRLQNTQIPIALAQTIRVNNILDTIWTSVGLDHYNRNWETGDIIFPWVGDTWDGGEDAYRAIQDLVGAEIGRFYSMRDGHARFLNRDYLADNVTSNDATFANEFEDIEYSYGEDLANHIRVEVTTRHAPGTTQLLWWMTQAQFVPNGTSVDMIVRYRANDGYTSLTLGATSLVTPVATTDYTANSAADGSGTDLTAGFSFTILSQKGSSALMRVTNSSGSNGYLTYAQLRGERLYQAPPMIVEAEDTGSIEARGRHQLQIDQPYFQDLSDAQTFADALLAARKDPQGLVKTITLSNRIRHSDALALTLFNRINIQEARANHNADYYIVGEAHTLDLAGHAHRIAWTLERVP